MTTKDLSEEAAPEGEVLALVDLEDDLIEAEVTADGDDEDDDEADAEETEGTAESPAALDELEAEELELLDEEVADTILVDEAAELRAIRREEMALDVEAHVMRGDEFVCQSCFLVKRVSQLANKRKMICRDCAE